MKTIKLFILSFTILSSLSVYAQDNNGVYEAPFQVTFIPPLGTNGLNAGNTINQFSLNILAGYAAGVDGVEIGGLVNINREMMNGVQFAGFTNITGGETTGLQFAGFGNINADRTDGLQFAGFSNINSGSLTGFQAAGFLNLARENSKAVQLAGFSNLSHEIEGVQIAGFSNISSGSVNGVQIAGFTNIANGTVKGAQLAGFLNVARKVDGVQISVFNIADTVTNGIPIGFLSIVRNGYREFEVGISEGLNTYASFKIGVKQFYNIFSVGMQNLSNKFRWGFGYGVGTHLSDRENLKVNLELMSYHINEGGRFTNAYNDLQQLKLTFAKPLSNNVSLFVGPTVNLMISDYYKKGSQKTGSNFAPYTIANQWSGNTSLQYWFGFNAGIRIH